MKYLFNFCLLGVILFSSCNNEEALYDNLYNANQTVLAPFNQHNPYDSIGEGYVSELQNLKALGVYRPGISKEGITIENRQSQTDSTLHSIEDLWGVINHSHLTLPARETLIDFTSIVLNFDLSDYDALYTYIVDYELQVLNSDVFTTEDKRVILSFSSIIRFSGFQMDAETLQSKNTEDEKEDDEEGDWDMSVPGMIAWFLAALNGDFQ